MKEKTAKSILALLIFSFIISTTACNTDTDSSSPTDIQEATVESASPSVEETEEPEVDSELDLEENNWVPETRAALNKLMADYGIRSESYDDAESPYVVFDFDNTTSFFDVQEALLIYQLENLRFNIAPEQMYDVLITEVPSNPLAKLDTSSNGRLVAS